MKIFKRSMILAFLFLIIGFISCEKEKITPDKEVDKKEISTNYFKEIEKTFGTGKDEFGRDIVQLSDSEYFILGNTYIKGPGNRDILLLKINNVGDTLWTKTFGTDGHDLANYFVPTNDGHYIIFGQSYNSENKVVLIKINKDGEIIWQKNHNGNANHMIETNDGGFAILDINGYPDPYIEYSSYYAEVRIIKLDKSGDELWVKSCGSFDILKGDIVLIQNSNSQYMLVGTIFDDQTNEKEISIIKTTSDGDPVFNKNIQIKGGESPISIIESIDGGYIIMSTISKGAPTQGMLMVKIDDDGNSIWQKRKAGKIYGRKLISLQNKYIVVGIQYEFVSAPSEVFIGEMDLEGNVIEISIEESIFGKTAQSLISLTNGGIGVVGSTDKNSNGLWDVYYLKLFEE